MHIQYSLPFRVYEAAYRLWQVNLDKLAGLGGYKTSASANTSWYGVRKKLGQLKGGAKTAAKLTEAELDILRMVFQCFEGGVPKAGRLNPRSLWLLADPT